MPNLDSSGDVFKCDRCLKSFDFTGDEDGINKVLDITFSYWRYVIFKNRRLPKCLDRATFCFDCAKKITPVIHELRDIDELSYYVNKLYREIRSHERNKNNWPTA